MELPLSHHWASSSQDTIFIVPGAPTNLQQQEWREAAEGTESNETTNSWAMQALHDLTHRIDDGEKFRKWSGAAREDSPPRRPGHRRFLSLGTIQDRPDLITLVHGESGSGLEIFRGTPSPLPGSSNHGRGRLLHTVLDEPGIASNQSSIVIRPDDISYRSASSSTSTLQSHNSSQDSLLIINGEENSKVHGSFLRGSPRHSHTEPDHPGRERQRSAEFLLAVNNSWRRFVDVGSLSTWSPPNASAAELHLSQTSSTPLELPSRSSSPDSPRPIPALHGPPSLPYARCPSGAEGEVFYNQQSLRDIVWDKNAPPRINKASLLHPDYLAIIEAGDGRNSGGDDIVVLVDRKLHSSRRSRGKHSSPAKRKTASGAAASKLDGDVSANTKTPEPRNAQLTLESNTKCRKPEIKATQRLLERLVPTEVGWARPLRDNEEEFPFNKTMTRNHKATLGALGEGEISKRNQILTSRPTSAELSHAGRMTPPHPPHSNVPLMATPVRHAEHLQKSSQKLRSAYNWGARPQTPTTAQGNPSTGLSWQQRTPTQRNPSLLMSPFPEWRAMAHATPSLSSPLFKYEPLFSPGQTVPSLSDDNSDSPPSPEEKEVLAETGNSWSCDADMSWGLSEEIPLRSETNTPFFAATAQSLRAATVGAEPAQDAWANEPIATWREMSGWTANSHERAMQKPSTKINESNRNTQQRFKFQTQTKSPHAPVGWGSQDKRPAGTTLWGPIPGELDPPNFAKRQGTFPGQPKVSTAPSMPSLDLQMSVLSLDGFSWPPLADDKKGNNTPRNTTQPASEAWPCRILRPLTEDLP